MFCNIPLFLKELDQWVNWKYIKTNNSDKPKKIPFNPLTGLAADVANPKTWATYEDVITYADSYDGIGFVIKKENGITFIDLDYSDNLEIKEFQKSVANHLNTYCELSPSNKGMHLIVKGNIQENIRDSRLGIEVYDNNRYMTMTGNKTNNQPILHREKEIREICDFLKKQNKVENKIDNNAHSDGPALISDDDVYRAASTAVNGEKFINLFNGYWQAYYASQSEADLSLINIIAFYTDNAEQVRRLFMASNLALREKAHKKEGYVDNMIRKSFDNKIPIEYLNSIRDAVTALIPTSTAALTPQENYKEVPPIPEGILRDLVENYLTIVPRPIPEIALAAAISVMAGITGRAYNVSGTGLNQYMLVLSTTGAGKEGLNTAIDRTFAAIAEQCPSVADYRGPATISSGQAITRHLSDKSNCFLALLGEFGHTIKLITSPKANPAEVAYKQSLLNLYHKSGKNATLQASVYADKEKNTKVVISPAVTIVGESNPSTFYKAINEDMLSEGFLPRFLTIAYEGKRPRLNKGFYKNSIDPNLVNKLINLTIKCTDLNVKNDPIFVKFSKEASIISDEFDIFCDDAINETTVELRRQLWNRAHLKVLRLSALLAVCRNFEEPIIEADMILWAKYIIEQDIYKLIAKYNRGEIGGDTDETKQLAELKRVIREYFTNGKDFSLKYISTMRKADEIYSGRIIPYVYLERRLSGISVFKGDRLGASAAIKRTIATLTDSGQFLQLSPQESAAKYGTTAKCFIPTDAFPMVDNDA